MSEHLLDPYDQLAKLDSPLLRTGFDTEADSVDGSMVVRLQGELDMATAPALGRTLNEALDTRPSAMALDLTELSFLDSTGIRVLVAASRRATAQGCSFALRSPTGSVLKALRLTGLDRLMVIDAGIGTPEAPSA